MQRNLVNLANTEFDLLVIGGGITGACIAHDAALRGLSVALVEKADFGAYTSSASSKLLHGGIRYLPKAQLGKVRESGRETAIFNHIAPHITRWIPFLVPTDNTALMKGAPAMHLAMGIYHLCHTGLHRLIADRSKLPPRERFLSSQQAADCVPLLDAINGLTGAQVLWESHMFNSERMTLAFIKSAASRGAQVANHCTVTELIVRGSGVLGARVYDGIGGETFEIRARLTMNAAGPYVQAINDSVPQLKLANKLTGFSKGIHLVTRQIEPEYALALTTRKKIEGLMTRGGRHFFIIPWRGRSLIGTADIPFRDSLDNLRVTGNDIESFLDEINTTLPEIRLSRDDVNYAFPGIYPLIAKEIRDDTYQGTGHYQIIDHQKNSGVTGIITTLGAKYTTARHVAAQGVNVAMAKLGRSDPGCRTASVRLAEGAIDDLSAFSKDCRHRYADTVDSDVLDSLIYNHGTSIHAVIAEGQRLGQLERLSRDRETLTVEVTHAVKNEMAITLDDLLFGRTGLGTIGRPSKETEAACVRIMAELLGWNQTEQQRQIERAASRYHYE